MLVCIGELNRLYQACFQLFLRWANDQSAVGTLRVAEAACAACAACAVWALSAATPAVLDLLAELVGLVGEMVVFTLCKKLVVIDDIGATPLHYAGIKHRSLYS